MNQLIGAYMFENKGPKPKGATDVFKVCWGIYHSSDMYAIAGNQRTPLILQNHKFFANKEKAEALKRDILEAFKTLGYVVQGYCVIEEDWYE